MGFYDDMVSRQIVERTLNFGGKTKTVYFRRLTAGERIALSRGQKMKIGGKSNTETSGVDIDLGDALQRTHKYLFYTNVDQNGNRVFKDEAEVASLPEDLVNALQRLADDALKDEEDGDAVQVGNDSPVTSS